MANLNRLRGLLVILLVSIFLIVSVNALDDPETGLPLSLELQQCPELECGDDDVTSLDET